MILIPPPPGELLPPYAVDIIAIVGWIIVGVQWWTRRKR